MSKNSSHLFSIGQIHYECRVVKSIFIPELQCTLRELIHEPSGAQIMHIENDDPENLFCLSFKTLPYNSNGVAHILEHTVLCGSEKFPVKDPFFAMNRRSLNTFMNALTGADFTCYPAASQVQKDFYNLLDVYLDAVFQPRLQEFSFLQEGHRLEFNNPLDSTSPLVYKGIVYNEMKGALSSPSARLAEAINESLFPDINYGYNSGGDPKIIPQLTYNQLKEFHQTYYHPSRCLFFFYGNMALEKHLEFIVEKTLKKCSKTLPLSPIPLQPRFKSPVYRELTYPILKEELNTEKCFIAFAWLTCHILEQQEALALNLLEIILMDTDASPLKKALLQSELCKQADSFIDIELNEIPWGITLRGCNLNHADAIEKVIRSTLNQVCLSGIPLKLIENAIHQLEFHRSEITGDHAPFGLSLFMRSALLKQHGADPTEGLMIHSLFERLRKTIVENPHYLTNLIKKYLIDNTHFVRIVMKPDPALSENEAALEKDTLKKIKDSLTPHQMEALITRTKQLAAFQKEEESDENIDLLPKVALKDIPLMSKDYSLIQETIGPLTIFHHSIFTNDIIYADVVFDLPNLKEEDLPYLRLLTVALNQVGCNGRSYLENLDYIQGNTGGIGSGIGLNLQAHDHLQFHPTFHLKGKALHRKAPELFSLLAETIAGVDLKDIRRLKEIILKHFVGLESRLNQNALKYAINLSASGLNPASKIANDLYGLNYYLKIREIAHHFDAHADFLIEKLQEIQNKVFSFSSPHLVLSCHSSMYDELKRYQFYKLGSIESIQKKQREEAESAYSHFTLNQVPSQGRITSSPVSFTGKVFSTVSYTHPDAPALKLAAFLFDNLALHQIIREQGGAYGGGAVSNAISGSFYFYSYRDPNIASTMKAFDQAVEMIVEGQFDDSDLEEAKLEMIQGLDVPVSPGSQGEVAYAWWREGCTHDLRQTFRNKIVTLKKKEIIDAVTRIIVPQMQKGSTVVFSNKKLLEKANIELLESGANLLNIYEIG